MPDGAAVSAFHASTRLYRFTLLLFVGMLTFGSYFAYDSIGAIENILIQKLGLSPGTIGSLYSAYSIAAIAIVFFSGVITDRLGTRRASFLFSSLVTLALMSSISVITRANRWPSAALIHSSCSRSGLMPSRSRRFHSRSTRRWVERLALI